MVEASNRKIQWITSSFFMLLYFCSLPTHAKYSGGTGEPDDPYQIATVEDLILLGESSEDYDKHFILTTDIDLDPNLPGRKVFDKAVIAPDIDPFKNYYQGIRFTGIFDGNGLTISNLTIKGTGYLGLFGRLGNRGKISNLGLDTVDVKGTGYYVGGLVGENYGHITTSYSTGIVLGYYKVGGLVGHNGYRTSICYSTATVTGNYDVGGLVGENDGRITTSYSIGAVTGHRDVGGLVGGGSTGDVAACFWDMQTSTQTTSAGGTGLATAEMQDIDTFLTVGWDFVDEIQNGTCNYWQISADDYPRLCYDVGDKPVMPEGLGTVEEPYLIRDARDLGTVWFEPMAHYRLEASLDLSGINWFMAVVPWFAGTFDGNDHVIKNLNIQGGGYLGLFGHLAFEANISNLSLEVVEINGTYDCVGCLVGYNCGSIVASYSTGIVSGDDSRYVGGLAGRNDEDGIITSCYSTANILGRSMVGGLTGSNHGTITRCYSKGSISGEDQVGGLVGFNWGTITNCSSAGNIFGNNYVGGLVGQISIWPGEGRITDCYSTCSVTGTTNVGGLVGSNEGTLWPEAEESRIADCYAKGRVAGTTNVGGLMGSNEGTITNCYSTGSVAGDVDVGGLVGRNGYAFYDSAWNDWTFIDGTISKCYSTGSISGSEDVGGLVGLNDTGTISNCYATCSASGGQFVGGLVGTNWGRISNCYTVGSVIGTKDVGGLVGLNQVDESVTFSFWNTETSLLSTNTGGTGKTTAEMQAAATFLEAGWDFDNETDNGTEDIWWILEEQSYPRLCWQYDKAFSPYPPNGAADVPQPLILSWLPGGSGLYHDIYFGEEKEAVANATIESQGIYRGRQEPEMTTYNPGNLELVKTYYWRIDEVNEADPNSFPKGNVWNFTTANFIIVDDFESYDAGDNQIWYSWHDGLGYGPPGAWDIGNHTGSAVGDETTPSYTEETIVHGGRQSMPYWYNNYKQGYAYYSEAEKWLSYPRDWTKESVSKLSLWFHGRRAPVGSFVEGSAGIYTMTGSGTDIGGEHDQFHFAYKSLIGPGSIVARIEFIENTHEWAKAGVMIRQGLYESSKHAFVYITPNNVIAFQARAEWGQTSVTTNQTGITVPLWIKLERDEAGNFMASHSANGTTWQPVQNTVSMNISMSSKVYIGLALTAHNPDAISQAIFSNVTITGIVSGQWEHQDIGVINNDPEPMYVTVSNRTGMPAVIYHDDPNAVRIDTWTEWIIPLSTFTAQGIDLTNVDRIAIGFGIRGNMTIPGGQGKMYFDDIRLYPPRPAESLDLEVTVP